MKKLLVLAVIVVTLAGCIPQRGELTGVPEEKAIKIQHL